jgi:hypothetical protein
VEWLYWGVCCGGVRFLLPATMYDYLTIYLGFMSMILVPCGTLHPLCITA